jgi:hypothetical protein
VSRVAVRILTLVIAVMVVLAGVALLARPAPVKETAWGDLCLYPRNAPPGICLSVPSHLPGL